MSRALKDLRRALLFAMVILAGVYAKSATQADLSSESVPTFAPWLIERISYRTGSLLTGTVQLRSGVYYEVSEAPFKGCVLYLEGLGDSALNHAPLYRKMSQEGYRVLFFDYMGQGGSEGTMNQTRLMDPTNRGLEISSQAQFIWEAYEGIRHPVTGNDCRRSPKMVMGWSTGGLAAYGLAHDGWADAVVLIAPGIHTKVAVGEAAPSIAKLLIMDQVITERTLTRNKFEEGHNPHVDAVYPTSPMDVPLFAGNLWLTSKLSQNWKISPQIAGLVFLSGQEDTYVDRDATMETLWMNAQHFSRVTYNGSLHEIDNEIPEVSTDMHQRTVDFFNAFLTTRK